MAAKTPLAVLQKLLISERYRRLVGTILVHAEMVKSTRSAADKTEER